MTLFELLAQATQPTGTGSGAAPPDMFFRTIFPLLLVVVVFYFFLWRGQSKERKKFEDMLNALKKGDRVLTIGGMFGTVVDVRDREVVLKVDETNNVKIRFTRAAIKEVLSAEAMPEPKKA